ncbi:MAG TPA: ABC transporter substrate-binding protein [Thermomicrobiales bacterium]|nr:ABC transporter substrate-binding protein [Thermomicrobiales bacterium]
MTDAQDRRRSSTPGRVGVLSRRRALEMAAVASGAVALGSRQVTAAAQAAATPVTGGTLIYGLSTDPPNLDPRVGSGYAAATVKQQVYSSLIRVNEKFEFLPELALSWKVATDRLSVTFSLRPNVKWHDGSPFTADDVKFTFDTILAADSTAAAKADLFTIDSVEVVDPLTVVFHLNQPDAMLLAVLQDNTCSIFSKSVVGGGADLTTTLIGTGPFKYVGRETGVSITLARNPDFWDPALPYLDGLVFQPISDDTARVSALQSGQVSLIDYVPQISQTELESSSDFKLYSDVVFTQMYVLLNQASDPLKKQLVRQAIAYAVDRDAVLQAVFFGRGKTLTGGVIPEIIGGSTKLDGYYTRDLDKAKALLTEAGYPDGIDLTLTVTSTYAFHQRTAEVVQATLGDANIRVKLELLEWATLLDRQNNGPYELMVQGGGFPYPHPAAVGSFVGAKSAVVKAEHYVDPDMDTLVASVRKAPDADSLATLAYQIDERMLEQLPRTFLVGRSQAEASSSKVSGYTHIPGGSYSGLNIRVTWLEG